MRPSGMTELVVQEMTKAEFDEWRESAIRGYAQDQITAGNWSAEQAEDLARKADGALLPDGFTTAGMLFLKALSPDQTPVGTVWVSLRHPRDLPDCGFIYDIEIEEAHRGLGYGKSLLAAAEDAVRSHGVNTVELNVFGANTRAIRLYEGAGYTVVTQQMRKALARG
jgi:ribosomal protein S18 acetylase RimI-like enzyme